jgi:hypothetical protein
MWVVTVDENGKEKDGHWVDIPEPDSFTSDGFAHIESYVTRLLSSTARFTSLGISTPDGQIALGLWQRGGIPEFSLTVEWRQEPERERERSIRQFFADRGFACREDYLAGNGGVPDATRCLTYSAPPDSEVITRAARDVLHDIYGLRESDALDFSYEEHHDAV